MSPWLRQAHRDPERWPASQQLFPAEEEESPDHRPSLQVRWSGEFRSLPCPSVILENKPSYSGPHFVHLQSEWVQLGAHKVLLGFNILWLCSLGNRPQAPGDSIPHHSLDHWGLPGKLKPFAPLLPHTPHAKHAPQTPGASQISPEPSQQGWRHKGWDGH